MRGHSSDEASVCIHAGTGYCSHRREYFMNRKWTMILIALLFSLSVATLVVGRRSAPVSKTMAGCATHHGVTVATTTAVEGCAAHAGTKDASFAVVGTVSAATLKPQDPSQEQHDGRTCTDDPNQKQDTDKVKVGCKCDTCSANEDTKCRSYCKQKNCTCKRPCA